MSLSLPYSTKPGPRSPESRVRSGNGRDATSDGRTDADCPDSHRIRSGTPGPPELDCVRFAEQGPAPAPRVRSGIGARRPGVVTSPKRPRGYSVGTTPEIHSPALRAGKARGAGAVGFVRGGRGWGDPRVRSGEGASPARAGGLSVRATGEVARPRGDVKGREESGGVDPRAESGVRPGRTGRKRGIGGGPPWERQGARRACLPQLLSCETLRPSRDPRRWPVRGRHSPSPTRRRRLTGMLQK